MKKIFQTKNTAGFFTALMFFIAAALPGTYVFAQLPPPPATPPPPGGGGGGPAGAPCPAMIFYKCPTDTPIGTGECFNTTECQDPSNCSYDSLTSACLTGTAYDSALCDTECTPGGGGGGRGGGTLPPIPEPKITSINDFYVALKAIAQWLLVFGIILGVIFIILGAISILTSQGEDQKVTTGKKTITWAVVGVTLLILAYAIVNIVAKFLGSTGNVIGP